jgi:hypothetical protein
VPEIVTSDKLLSFLVEQNDRASRRPGEEERVIGIKTYEAYVSAMTDLWKQQRHAGINPQTERPRNHYIISFLDNKARQSAEISMRNYDDRGTGTLLDGYSTSQELAKIIAAGFTLHNTVRGLQAAAAFSFSHSTLLRGDNIRRMDLANLFSMTLEDEGIDSSKPSLAVVASLIRSKTNTDGMMFLRWYCISLSNHPAKHQ